MIHYNFTKRLCHLLLFLTILCPLILTSQNKKVDSLLKASKNGKEDSTRINTYIKLIKEYKDLGDKGSMLSVANSLLELSERLKNAKGLSEAHNTIGMVYKSQGNYSKALEHYLEVLRIRESLNDKQGIANVNSNIGNLYMSQKNHQKAIEYNEKALQARIELKDNEGIAISYNNLGTIYNQLRDYKKGSEQLEKAVEIWKALGKKNQLGTTYNNLASSHKLMGENAYSKGDTVTEKKEYETAINYLLQAIEIKEQEGDKNSIALCNGILANIYTRQKKYELAKEKYMSSLAYFSSSGHLENEIKVYASLAALFYKMGNYKTACEYETKYANLKDSLFTKESARQIGEMNAKYETEKKEQQIKLLNKDKELQDAELEKQNLVLVKNQQDLKLLEKENTLKEMYLVKQEAELESKNMLAENQRKNIELLNKDKALKESEAEQKEMALKQQKSITYFFATGGILLLALLIFAYRGYVQKKQANTIILGQKQEVEKQKHLIEEQKEVVEEKQKEILDSITYAKRLQEAILPSESEMFKDLPDSYLVYLPKDIVAGDFYWMERINDLLFFAVADSTGHGVPGAMVSVVCSNALHRTVVEFGITEPGKILDKAREIVIQTFAKSDKDVKDGMDISLISLDIKTKKVSWAGANNPLWYIQNSQINEVTANKQPIGKTIDPVPFTTHQIHLNKGDSLFLFTDGYADQFGGPKGKKFKYKPFKELLESLHDKDPDFQKTELTNAFDQWKGTLEQVDDVCIIGLRL